jgi:hypothetical protein
MQASLALVHHANQYLITDGYENREGLAAVVGSARSGSGLAHVLDLHVRSGVAINLHISGTLLEAIAWHQPEFVKQLRDLIAADIVELVGSSYGQNIMRFFGPDYNRKQLNEELLLYRYHLGVDPERVKTFWPPERVWETRRMAPVLRDAQLLNGGYRYAILDDRLLLSSKDDALPRGEFDEKQSWSPDLFKMHEVEEGLGLTLFPIATRLRRSIPPRSDQDWVEVQRQLEALLVHASEAGDENLLAVYADDLEKVAGIGEWGGDGPAHYRRFLDWLSENRWIKPVKLSEWAKENQTAGRRRIETGTFQELARDFDAGEGYERWYLAPDWAPYRGYFTRAESRVKEAQEDGADASLLALAEKQLLVGNWETAWHTPASGPHGDPDENGHASPWARALTSHVRLAGVTAEAARWMRLKDGSAHAQEIDIDGDGDAEVVLRNSSLFGVITPRWGGRLVSLFSVAGSRGAMVVGNPCDDWNWMEDLNKFMEVPRNHPGCFADVAFENDEYRVEHSGEGETALLRLVNVEKGSAASGLTKEYRVENGVLAVHYGLPRGLRRIAVECALSPDYLQLLRGGFDAVEPYSEGSARGFSCRGLAVWIEPVGARFTEPVQSRCGHGCMMAVESSARSFEIRLGVTDLGSDSGREPRALELAEPLR